MMTRSKAFALGVALLIGWMGTAELASAANGRGAPQRRSIRRRGRSWVPQEAWNAVKARAQSDLGKTTVRLYKTRWSKALSKGLKSQLDIQGDAYIVHAKVRGSNPGRKKQGPYLAVKSSQGHFEVFPLALAADSQGRPARNRHITKADARARSNNTYAFADGELGGTKVVQAVEAKNTRLTFTQQGQIVAEKNGRNGTKTFFLLGDPNRNPGQDRGDPAAIGKVGLSENAFMARPQPRQATSQQPSNTSIRPPFGRISTLNTKFIEVAKPAVGPIMPLQRD